MILNRLDNRNPRQQLAPPPIKKSTNRSSAIMTTSQPSTKHVRVSRLLRNQIEGRQALGDTRTDASNAGRRMM